MQKTPEEYLKEPYSRILIPDERGTVFAEILEFPGCVSQGKTVEEAFENLEEVAKSWIEAALHHRQEIPSASLSHEFSGKLVIRLPRGLHRRAAQKAERDRTSLNQFLATAIAERLGADDLYNRMVQKLAQTQINFINMPVHISNISMQSVSSSNKESLTLSLSELTNGESKRKFATKVLSGKRNKKQKFTEAENG
ncbi:MAG: type II toxin-antitoxin system HicB family antitoxin [Candidatus Methylomirabilis oxyfera]|nr:type II toxin-antitoxin system HicB family antitoxin [Candidatus Methylomirabilis oxyfera]